MIMKHTFLVKEWFGAFLSLLFPRCCVVCGRPLAKGEECICAVCNMDLPRTDYHLRRDNPVELLFWGKFPLERATSFFYYRKGSDFRRILHLLKYGGQKEIGAIMGRYMAAELIESGFFQGIFELHHAESLIGKHVLIVDDVLTTGATTVACASRIMEVEGIRISVLTLAVAD